MACCWFLLATGTTKVFCVLSCTTAKTVPQRLGPNEHHQLEPKEGTTDMKKAVQLPCKNSSALPPARAHSEIDSNEA
jgi:hypothetical protein